MKELPDERFEVVAKMDATIKGHLISALLQTRCETEEEAPLNYCIQRNSTINGYLFNPSWNHWFYKTDNICL